MESGANLQARLNFKVRSACSVLDAEFEVVWLLILHPPSEKVLGMIIRVNTQNDRLVFKTRWNVLLIPPYTV